MVPDVPLRRRTSSTTAGVASPAGRDLRTDLLDAPRQEPHSRKRALAVGGISGGAFNPAIALGAMVPGLFEWSNIWVYLVADVVGGAVAAWAFLFVLPAEKATGDMEAATAE